MVGRAGGLRLILRHGLASKIKDSLTMRQIVTGGFYARSNPYAKRKDANAGVPLTIFEAGRCGKDS